MTSRIGIQSGQVMSIQLSYPDFSDPVTPDPGTVAVRWTFYVIDNYLALLSRESCRYGTRDKMIYHHY